MKGIILVFLYEGNDINLQIILDCIVGLYCL
jgi:hypothetical protein